MFKSNTWKPLEFSPLYSHNSIYSKDNANSKQQDAVKKESGESDNIDNQILLNHLESPKYNKSIDKAYERIPNPCTNI